MALDAWAATLIFALSGLLIGSFLNVVVYRLPVMLQRAWRHDSVAFLREQGVGLPDDAAGDTTPFNLVTPRSRCRACGHPVSALENVPVLSYLLLRGRCRACKTPIGMRYPLVELATAAAFAFCGHQWGVSWTAAAWALFCAVLIALILIDWDTTLLPDSLTLPLLWAGLMASWAGLIAVPLRQSVLGAAVGYLSLWSIAMLFKLVTKKEGMGHGDFKLLAALGAWLGAGAVLPIVLASSLLGAVVGVVLKLRQGLREGGYIPYGPFLGGAGLLVLLCTPERVNGWLNGLMGF